MNDRKEEKQDNVSEGFAEYSSKIENVGTYQR